MKIPDYWPEWPQEGLEHLGRCPICNGNNRTLLHDNLIDPWFHAPGRWKMYLCSECQSGYLDPRPSQDTISLAYANYLTHAPLVEAPQRSKLGKLSSSIRNGYLNQRYRYRLSPASRWGHWIMFALPAPFRWEWDQYARHLAPPCNSGMRLLDIGCGNGSFLVNAREAGWAIDGIEPDEKAASIGREHGLRIHSGTYQSAPFPAATFDAITANQVIEHLHDPHDFVTHIYHWLKPGGHVWIGTPNIDCLIHKRFQHDYGNLHAPQHLTLFSPSTLRSLFETHGFSAVQFRKRGIYDYRRSLVSLALSKGMTGTDAYQGNSHPSLLDHLRGIGYELAAWRSIDACSDLVMTAMKPAA